MKSYQKFLLSLGLAATVGFLITRQRNSPGSKLPNQSIYRFYAPIYDALFGGTYASARRRTVQLLNLKPGEHLLIPGVGTGLDLPQIPAGVSATGVDVSHEMLSQAQRKPCQANVTLIPMDAQKLNFADHTFDAALLSLIVSVAPDGQAVFREAWRTLKPGGRLVMFDKFAPETGSLSPLRQIFGAFFRLLGTDVNRRSSDILGNTPNLIIERDEASIFAGQYRILYLRKSM